MLTLSSTPSRHHAQVCLPVLSKCHVAIATPAMSARLPQQCSRKTYNAYLICRLAGVSRHGEVVVVRGVRRGKGVVVSGRSG